MSNEPSERPRAVIAAVQLQGVDDGTFQSSIAELRRLASTLGLEVVGMVTQRRTKLAPGQVFGDGKLKELAAWTGGKGEIEAWQTAGQKRKARLAASAADAAEEGGTETATETDPQTATETEAEADPETDAETATATDDAFEVPDVLATVVLIDHDLSPTQQRNLERATEADVLDRTQVILGIFHRHAKTREARLQVEIARLGYEAPRLRETGGGGDRVRGGVGGKGAGESSLELDRRRIRDRIAELRRELGAIEGSGKVRRQRRGDARTIAVVGYTNAGKSSLMRALTGSDVYVADKLFATLDTTVRVLEGRVKPPILLSDTVGFIKKLPHDLVASFRSTLEEAAEADLLLHVVDAADPALRDHMTVTRTVLGEVGADAPALIVLNKVDKLTPEQRGDLELAFPDAVLMSAKDPADVAALRERLVEHFAGASVIAELMVPWSRHGVVHDLHTRCRVLEEHHDEHGTRVTVKAPAAIVDELKRELAAD